MTTQTNATTLLAIMVAARKTGDRDLERQARHDLELEHGIKIRFARDKVNDAHPSQRD
jgi:hypothetical protein